MGAQPRLIGLDWGTSALRAYLLGEGGTVIDRRSRPWGVMSVPDRDFAAALRATIGDWDASYPGLPAIAAGMIGSSEGWVRAPYCACPAGLSELAAGLVAAPAERNGPLLVVPGVELRGAAPNVMRGEETQIMGALASSAVLEPDNVFVLPGTHSKWVEVRAARIVRFDTFITGELYALLAGHSILSRPSREARAGSKLPDDADAERAFDWGASTARDSGARGAAPLLFLTRSLVLAGQLRPEISLDFLSGLLIGEELRSALTQGYDRIALVGEPALCSRYQRAFALLGLRDVARIDDTAPAGLWRIARGANLVPSSIERAG